MTRRKINILLIRYPGMMATFLTWWTRFRYTHATIGLEEDMNTFYSFMRKGFIIEKVTRYLKPDREPFPCALYEIEVPDQIYQRVKSVLQSYVERKESLRYTHRSMLLSLVRIPLKLKDRYFCTYFVAEVLQQANAAKLPCRSILCFAPDLHRLEETKMVYQGDLQGMVDHYRLLEQP